MEEYKKISMLDQFSIAVSSPKNYKHLTKLKTGRLVAYVILITFLITFIQYGINVITFVIKADGIKNLLQNNVPEFVYENGQLEMQDKLELAIGDYVIYADSDKETISLDDIDTDGAYIAIGKTNIVIGLKSNGQKYETLNYKLATLFPMTFDHTVLVKMTPAIYVYLVMAYIVNMIGHTIKILLFALLFSIIGRSMADNFKTGLSRGKVYAVCIYGLTTALLLSSVNAALDYIIPASLMLMIGGFLSFIFISRGILCHADLSKTHNNL